MHKVVAIWKYDKRPSNGADVNYFGNAVNAHSIASTQMGGVIPPCFVAALSVFPDSSHASRAAASAAVSPTLADGHHLL